MTPAEREQRAREVRVALYGAPSGPDRVAGQRAWEELWREFGRLLREHDDTRPIGLPR